MSGLVRHLNLVTLWGLPDWSAAPRGDALPPALEALGVKAVQGHEPAACEGFGLLHTLAIKATTPAEVRAMAERGAASGALSTTLHLGHGLEDEEAADALCRAVTEEAERTGHPLSVETHRATLFQDPWRALRLVRRHPALRFTADLSHWYTGCELPYADWPATLAALRPVFERAVYVHGRIGDACCMQVALEGPGDDRDFVRHHRELLTALFRAYREAGPDAPLPFAPELLPNEAATPDGTVFRPRYARTFEGREESDRWAQAGILFELADACWAASG